MERAAQKMLQAKNFNLTLDIYYMMTDQRPSLDAGYLVNKIGTCYEMLGQLQSAKYWYDRAVEENPEIVAYKSNRERLDHVYVDQIVEGEQILRDNARANPISD